MTFQQLKFVLETARCGSINKAAAMLYVSQSNLSSAIRELETELGIELFTRNNRGVILTERGREFIALARPIMEQKERIDDFYSRQVEEPRFSFSVSSQRYAFTVKAVLAFLEQRGPKRMEVQVKETDMYQVIDDVLNNKSDLGVIFLSSNTEKFISKALKHKEIEFVFIKSVQPRVFLRSTHPLARLESVALYQLRQYPYVAFGQEKGVSMDYAEEISVAESSLSEQRFLIHDRATAYNIIANTDAFSLGSGILPEGFHDARIVSVPIESGDGADMAMSLGWIKRRGAVVTRDMEDFVECLRRAIDEE